MPDVQDQGRTLFLAQGTFANKGGIQRFNQRVIAALEYFGRNSDSNLPVVHLTQDSDKDIPAHLRPNVIGFGKNRLSFFLNSLKITRNIQTLIVGHVNFLPLAAAAKFLNPKLQCILFVHGIEVWNDPIYRTKKFYEPLLLRFVDTVASVSQFTADRMALHFGVPKEKFSIFPNAVDGPVLKDKLPSREQVILSVTRMAAHDHGKNVESIIRAFAKLQPRVPSSRLEIVGDGVLRRQFETLAAKLGIAAHVKFLGRVTDEELERCYERATAFVLPSSKEGFGIVYLEAWKHGLPVICGTEGASKEVVSHEVDGFVIDPSDLEALSRGMEKLLTDEVTAATFGSAGASKVERHFLDASFRDRLAALLQSSKH